MHLLLIHQNFPGQFRELAPAWLQMGYEVTALGSASAPTETQRWAGLTYLQYSVEGTDNPTDLERGEAVFAACKQLKDTGSGPDVVLVHSGWGEARRLREVFPHIPLVVFPELWGNCKALGFEFDHHMAGLTQPQDCFDDQNQLSAAAINSSDVAIVPNTSQYDSFPSHLREQLTILPEGLDLQHIIPDSSATVQIGELRFKCGDPIVTFISRYLEPLRGLRLALQAWPTIAAAVPNAQFILVGQRKKGYGIELPFAGDIDHLDAAISALPQEVDLTQIHVLEWMEHDEMLKLLQCSACHLALSYPYTLSWSVLEAMACGAPLISNYGSPIAPELIHELNGLLVPFNEPYELAQTAITLLNNTLLRKKLGYQARITMEERFGLESSLIVYKNLFQKLTKQNLSATNPDSSTAD